MPRDIEEKITVFLSYSHKDKAFCDQLRKDLERLPVEVVRDIESFTIGRPLEDEILQRLRAVDHVVCLISRESLESTWVLWELKETLDDKSAESPKLIPAFLDRDFLDNKTIKEIQSSYHEEAVDLAEQAAEAVRRNENTDHLDARRKFIKDVIDKLPQIVTYLRDVECLDMCRTEYGPSFSRLAEHLLGRPYDAQLQEGASQRLNTDIGDRIRSIKQLLFKGGDAKDREDALSEAAVQTAQCVEDFAPHDVELIVKATMLCAQIRNAYSELSGEVLVNKIDKIVNAMLVILQIDLLRMAA